MCIRDSFIAVSVIFGLVSILAFYIFIKRKLISLKCLKAVFNTGASRHALEEFTDIASKRYGSDNIILGASYIFCPDFGIIYLLSLIHICYSEWCSRLDVIDVTSLNRIITEGQASICLLYTSFYL